MNHIIESCLQFIRDYIAPRALRRTELGKAV